MKTKKINLLISRFDYQEAERRIMIFRNSVLGLSLFILVLVSASFFFLGTLNSKIKSLEARKAQLTSSTNQKINREEELNYVARKVDLMDTYLKNDAHSLPYYNLLLDAMGPSTESARLTGFVINNKRDTEFEVTFTNLNDMLSFFKTVESEVFLKNFETLTLGNFESKNSRLESSAQVKSYVLTLHGRFIPLKETDN